jgi:hypothetical protein
VLIFYADPCKALVKERLIKVESGNDCNSCSGYTLWVLRARAPAPQNSALGESGLDNPQLGGRGGVGVGRGIETNCLAVI